MHLTRTLKKMFLYTLLITSMLQRPACLSYLAQVQKVCKNMWKVRQQVLLHMFLHTFLT